MLRRSARPVPVSTTLGVVLISEDATCERPSRCDADGASGRGSPDISTATRGRSLFRWPRRRFLEYFQNASERHATTHNKRCSHWATPLFYMMSGSKIFNGIIFVFEFEKSMVTRFVGRSSDGSVSDNSVYVVISESRDRANDLVEYDADGARAVGPISPPPSCLSPAPPNDT